MDRRAVAPPWVGGRLAGAPSQLDLSAGGRRPPWGMCEWAASCPPAPARVRAPGACGGTTS
eukprot:916751-Pyramimonas_sp.AAC.1